METQNQTEEHAPLEVLVSQELADLLLLLNNLDTRLHNYVRSVGNHTLQDGLSDLLDGIMSNGYIANLQECISGMISIEMLHHLNDMRRYGTDNRVRNSGK